VLGTRLSQPPNSRAGPVEASLFFPDAHRGSIREGWRTDRDSGKRFQKRLHSVNQILPGEFDRFLKPGDLAVIGILEFLDAVLELRETSAHVLELPIVLKLDADLLLGEAALQESNARGQILNFTHDTV
jgi:hypothetical protein